MRISHLWCLWHINWRAAQLPVGGTCTGAAVVLAAFVQVVSPVFMPACSVLSSTMLFLAHISCGFPPHVPLACSPSWFLLCFCSMQVASKGISSREGGKGAGATPPFSGSQSTDAPTANPSVAGPKAGGSANSAAMHNFCMCVLRPVDDKMRKHDLDRDMGSSYGGTHGGWELSGACRRRESPLDISPILLWRLLCPAPCAFCRSRRGIISILSGHLVPRLLWAPASKFSIWPLLQSVFELDVSNRAI